MLTLYAGVSAIMCTRQCKLKMKDNKNGEFELLAFTNS